LAAEGLTRVTSSEDGVAVATQPGGESVAVVTEPGNDGVAVVTQPGDVDDVVVVAGAGDDLKRKTVKGGVAKLGGQAANFVLRLAYLMIMARLLTPEQFGLVAMVTVVTGFYDLFTSAGLSSATVQRANVSNTQVSTLFWINILIGVVLSGLCLATAPALVAFYHEPRLLWVTAAMALGFLINAAGVQHIAILQRDVRYVTLAAMEVTAQALSLATGITLAVAGAGYWAIVASTLAIPTTMTALAWAITRWVPKRPRRDPEIWSMLRFGGTVTIQSVVAYGAQNVDKVLVGRYLGANTLGLYGRAYTLVNMPSTNLSGAVGWVAFSALSRLQEEPARLRNYFLKGYTVLVTVIVPVLLFGAVFADDVVRVALGPQWDGLGHILRLLVPAALVTVLTGPPTYWLLHALGFVGRSLCITLAFSAVFVVACFVGVSHGAAGLALACSIALLVWLVPHLAWSVYHTPVDLWSLLHILGRAFVAGIAASLLAYAAVHGVSGSLARIALGGILTCGIYCAIDWFVFRRGSFYMGLARDLKQAFRG
jgi:PST family polysaccharide transporter